jgi:protein-ribulosamine 3-kinase
MNPLEESLAAVLGSETIESRPVGGGCIHDARRLRLADGRCVFLKTGNGQKADMLVAEARGLSLLAPHIRVPRIIAEASAADGTRWLALEWLDLGGLSARTWTDLGRRIKALHSVTADLHGLDHENFIGATPQTNRPAESWSWFYQESRLRPQLRLARSRGHDLPAAEILAAAARLLADHDPASALLHGDLWSGNTAALSNGSAVVFDPAPYYGDPETDLAMLELFGGPLPADFLRGYGPTAPDRARRRPLYDLYHALNHLNLFGAGYSSMVRNSCSQLFAVAT